MSYTSEHILGPGASIQDVREFVSLLGFKKAGVLSSVEYGRFEEYWYFDETDYRSWSGVELAIHRLKDGRVVVSTGSTIGRSYYDLSHQNFTISALRRRFKGDFRTDEGKGRYLRPEAEPTSPPASGCHLAFNRFGSNLIKAALLHEARAFPEHPPKMWKFLSDMDPRLLANNTLVPFLVAALEDYFKSTFVALLKYSPRKEAFLRGVRLQGEQLAAISDGMTTVEEKICETLPFQRISAVCRHFEALDPKLDIAGPLRKPYRKRRVSFFDQLEGIVLSRHNFIHRAILDRSITDERMDGLIRDLDVALTRIYRRISKVQTLDLSIDLDRAPASKITQGEVRLSLVRHIIPKCVSSSSLEISISQRFPFLISSEETNGSTSFRTHFIQSFKIVATA